VGDARVAPRDLVVEIGAGSGMLTRPLLACGARVFAVEPDRVHARRLRCACPLAQVRECSWRDHGWPEEPFKIVANLPFAEAADLCRALFSDPRLPLQTADLIVEWDFAAKRARLWPSTAQTVVWSAWYELSVVRRLPPFLFAPQPSVAGGILRARRRDEPLVDPRLAARYEAFVRRQFRRDPRARDTDPHGWAIRFRAGEERPFESVR
jgi:23S rRNA (adenine-N6)-dimethyltransferase